MIHLTLLESRVDREIMDFKLAGITISDRREEKTRDREIKLVHLEQNLHQKTFGEVSSSHSNGVTKLKVIIAFQKFPSWGLDDERRENFIEHWRPPTATLIDKPEVSKNAHDVGLHTIIYIFWSIWTSSSRVIISWTFHAKSFNFQIFDSARSLIFWKTQQNIWVEAYGSIYCVFISDSCHLKSSYYPHSLSFEYLMGN